MFTQIRNRARTEMRVQVHSGDLAFQSCAFEAAPGQGRALYDGKLLSHRVERQNGGLSFHFEEAVIVNQGKDILLEIQA